MVSVNEPLHGLPYRPVRVLPALWTLLEQTLMVARTLVQAAGRTRPGTESASGVVGAASVFVQLHCTASGGAGAGAGLRGTLGAEGVVGTERTPRSRLRVEELPAGNEGGGGDSRSERTRSNMSRCAAAACCTRIEI